MKRLSVVWWVGMTGLAWAAGAGNLTKTDDQSTVQTAKTLWTPTSGYKIVLQGCAASGGLIGNRVKFQSAGVDVIPNQASTPTNTVSLVGNPLWVGAKDGTLTYTSTLVSASAPLSVMCWGTEQTP